MKKIRTVRRLSWSQMSAYENCPLAWYKHYILKLWPDEKAQPLSFGIAYHSGAEVFLDEYYNQDIPQEVAINNACSRFDFEYSFGKEKGPNTKKWLPIGNTMLRATAALLLTKDFKLLSLERFVSRKGFLGKVDCQALVDGKRMIIDWKTATYPFTQERVDTDGQLTGYGYLLQGNWDALAFVVAIKETSEVHWYETTRTQRQIDEFVKRIENAREKMEFGEKFIGAHSPNACKWCDLKPYNCRGVGDF